MDKELRRLERLAATGDPEAIERLKRLRDKIDPMTMTEEILAAYLGDQRSKPNATLDLRWGIIFTLDLFNFLNNTAEYDDDLQNQYDDWVETNRLEDEWDRVNMENFVNTNYPDALGPFGGELIVENTYNYDTCLSRDFQFITWEHDNDTYALIQIHLGGDPRGGYSTPYAFKVEDEFFENSRGIIYCSNDACTDRYGEITRWYSDDGYHWHGDGDEPPLHECEIFRLEEWPGQELEEPFNIIDYRPDDDILFVTHEGQGYCPLCRIGFLEPESFYA